MPNSYQQTYDRKNKAPLWWYNKSSDLHASAGTLWLAITGENDQLYQEKLGLCSNFKMSVACWPVYEMLFGMALELILKAIVVASGNKPSHTHNLVSLTQGLTIKLDKTETSILKHLTESIIWDGRYPVPKKPNFLEEHLKNSNDLLFDSHKMGKFEVKKYNNLLCWENLDSLWRKLVVHFFDIKNHTNGISI